MSDYVIFNAEFPDGKEKSFTSKERTAREKYEAQTAEKIKEFAKGEYARQRQSEYPSIQECVHAILDDDLDALQKKRAEIKKKYPKG